MKSADERIDNLERQVARYRILVLVMIVLLVVIQRDTLGGWADKCESWLNRVTSVKADASQPRQNESFR